LQSGKVSVSLGNVLWLLGAVIDAALVGLLIYRRVWRSFPFFFAYCVSDLCVNGGTYFADQLSPGFVSVDGYLAETILDSVLQVSVLVELAWSVLRPLRAHLTRKSLLVVGGIFLIVGAAIWPFASLPDAGLPNWEIAMTVQMQHTAAILRILFFVLLASLSQFLSIGWRDRELQIATGFGFFSLVSLAVTFVHPPQGAVDAYQMLNSIVVIGYLCSLLYFVYCFLHEEAPRREFTTQMRTLLLSLAGTAHTSRIQAESLRESAPKEPDPNELDKN